MRGSSIQLLAVGKEKEQKRASRLSSRNGVIAFAWYWDKFHEEGANKSGRVALAVYVLAFSSSFPLPRQSRWLGTRTVGRSEEHRLTPTVHCAVRTDQDQCEGDNYCENGGPLMREGRIGDLGNLVDRLLDSTLNNHRFIPHPRSPSRGLNDNQSSTSLIQASKWYERPRRAREHCEWPPRPPLWPSAPLML